MKPETCYFDLNNGHCSALIWMELKTKSLKPLNPKTYLDCVSAGVVAQLHKSGALDSDRVCHL